MFVIYAINLKKQCIKCLIYLSNDEREHFFSADKELVSFISTVIHLKYNKYSTYSWLSMNSKIFLALNK